MSKFRPKLASIFTTAAIVAISFAGFAHAATLAVNVSSPTFDQNVSGTVSLVATVTGGDSAATVQFAVDGTPLSTQAVLGMNGSYSSTWDSTKVSNGSHTISATVFDDGSTAISDGISANVNNVGNNGQLGVTIISPAAAAVVSGVTTLIASTGGPYAARSVQFLINGSDMGGPVTVPDASGNYDFTMNSVQYQNGSYTLSAIVTDIYGHTANAAVSVTFTVRNSLAGNSPSVIMTAPAGGVSLSGTVQLSAAVTLGSAPIQSVQFLLDGADLGSAVTAPSSAATYMYSWDTTTATEGAHALSAIVTDTAGATGSSSAVSISVANDLPTIAITAPAAGATLTGSVALTAAVTAGASPIQYVQFTVDGRDVGVPVTYAITTGNYSYTWDSSTVYNGTHAIGAEVLDQTSHSAQAPTVSVTTSNAGSPAAPAGTTTASAPGVHPNHTLIVLNGTYYVISGSQLLGITSPGILASMGYTFSEAVPASAADGQLTVGQNAAPSDGSLVKTATDQTVYVIADQQRHPFSSASAFTGHGYSFASVLTVTSPELYDLPLGAAVTSVSSQHLHGADVSNNGTVYWLDDTSRHPYPSLDVWNSWHIPGDFSTVVPANSADLSLPVANAVVAR